MNWIWRGRTAGGRTTQRGCGTCLSDVSSGTINTKNYAYLNGALPRDWCDILSMNMGRIGVLSDDNYLR